MGNQNPPFCHCVPNDAKQIKTTISKLQNDITLNLKSCRKSSLKQQSTNFEHLVKLDEERSQQIQNLISAQRTKNDLDHLKASENYKELRLPSGGIYKGLANHNNQPHGQGELYFKNGSYMISQFENSKAQGQLFYVSFDRLVVRGKVSGDRLDGDVTQQYQNFSFSGRYHNGVKQQGEETNGEYTFMGSYTEDRWRRGILKWKQDNQEFIYEGSFNQHQQFQGKKCTLKQPQGHYQGEFKSGQKHGWGRYEYRQGINIYQGDYYKGLKQGRGTIFRKNRYGSWVKYYEGGFSKGLPHGKGHINREGKPTQEVTMEEGINKDLIYEAL